MDDENPRDNTANIAKRKNFMLKHVGRIVSIPNTYFGDPTILPDSTTCKGDGGGG